MRWHWLMVSMAILFLVPMCFAEGAEKVTASGERYVVVLGEEVGQTEAARLASVYGGVLERDGAHGGRQFVVWMASSRARMMSLDPHVVSVSEQSRHLTPLPTGSGSMTLGPYTYDGSGNVRSIGPEGNQEQYIYDALGRLTSATAGVTNTQTYQYDAFGNRTVVTRTGSNCTGDTVCEQQGTYLAETNHLNNNGAVYDEAGNLTAYVADRYKYDAAGMLARASVSGDRQYLYTAFDERIAVYDGTFNWRWTVRSEDGKVLREFTSTNDPSTGELGVANRQWVKDYVWRNGQLLATENRKAGGGTVTEHYHLDHLGTPRLVTDGTGLKLATHTYYAFGAELMGTPESPETGMKFTGHERDITGTSDALDNMHARYYSSLTGRFLSVDPMLDLKKTLPNPQMWNRYSYVVNNPMRYTDPDGREHVNEQGFTKPLSEAGGWADQPSVSWAFNSEALLLSLAADEFVIGPAIGKVAGAVGRFAGRFFGKAEEAVETGAKLSRYEDVTTGRSVANRATNVSRANFAKNLESNGFTKAVSKDGKVTIFQKNGVKYTLRETAKSTGGPTAEVFMDGKLVAKLRLGAQ